MWPPGFGPLSDDDVDAGSLMTLGVLRTARERSDQLALLFAAVDEELRGRPKGVHHEGGVVGERDVEQRHRLLGAERRAAPRTGGGHVASGRVVIGQVGDVVAIKDVGHELAMGVGDQRRDVVECVATVSIAGVFGRHDQVDAVRLSAHFVLDPFEVDLELFWRVRNSAEDTEPAGFRDCGDDVATMAEGKDREFDVEHLGGSSLHPAILAATAALGRTRCTAGLTQPAAVWHTPSDG